MHRRTLSLSAVGLLVALASACAATAPAGGPAAAAPAAPAKQAVATAPAAAKQPSKFHPDDLVCRTYDVTGTRIGKQRICKTREQWAQDSRYAQEAMRSIQDSGSMQPGGESLGSGAPR